MNRLDFIEKDSLRRDLPPFRVGDQVRVHVKVREGDKERIQVFEGLCLRRRGGSAGETFTVRKISNGVGVERIFPVQSPLVTKLEIMSRGFVRRSRLYYLRDLTGKKARLHSKVRDVSHLISPEEEDARAADAAGEEGSKARKKRGKKAKAARGSSKSDAAAEKKAAKKESRKTAKKSAKAEPKPEPKAEAEAAAPEVVAEEAAAPEVVAEEPAATEESES